MKRIVIGLLIWISSGIQAAEYSGPTITDWPSIEKGSDAWPDFDDQ